MTSKEGRATALELTRDQIVAFRRRVNELDERLPPGPESLRRAAWAGLPDSMPRAAVLSIHARVAGTKPDTWADSSLVQLWGPRFSVYVVSAEDIAPFSLGRLTDGGPSRRTADDLAKRLHDLLDGRRMPYDDAGIALGIHPNALRYAATTGTVLLRWEGARRPVVWTVPRPRVEPEEARAELARRFLHVFGPTTTASFAKWAGIGPKEARDGFAAIERETVQARTPIGEAIILASDEATYRAKPGPTAPARLLPSGDTFVLLWRAERQILVEDARRQAELWTPRVWPGALLVGGEIAGTWRRADANLAIDSWRKLSKAEREAVEAEAASLPLPGLEGKLSVRWQGAG
jgi:hypothetical protein